MVRKLLIVAGASALVSVACFGAANALGGFKPPFGHPSFGDWEGHWDDDRGPDVSRDLAWSGSPEIDIGYPAEITFTQGPQAKFTVKGPQRLVDELRLEDGRLRGPHRHRHGGRLEITIVSPSTHAFRLAGAQELRLNNYDQDVLELHAAGAVDVRGQGRARRLEAHVSGAGDLDLDDLVVQEAEVSISGAGDANLDARSSADVSISGAGHVKLKSRPPHLSTHISGFGSVEAPDGPPAETPPAPAAAPKSKA